MTSDFQPDVGRDEAVWRTSPLSGVELLSARWVRQRFPRHTHDCFVFCVNEAGAHRSWYAGSTVIIPHGAVTVVPPGDVHTGEPVPGYPWHYRAMYVSHDMVSLLAQELGFPASTSPSFPSLFMTDESLADRFARIHLQCERTDDDLEAESLIPSTLMEVLQRHARGGKATPASLSPRAAVERAIEFIRDSYAEHITLDALADAAMVSRYALLRVFRREVGLSPYAYLTQVRIERAKSLLRNGVGIAATAARTGFSDQSHFTRHFKRLIGVTPATYAGYPRSHRSRP